MKTETRRMSRYDQSDDSNEKQEDKSFLANILEEDAIEARDSHINH